MIKVLERLGMQGSYLNIIKTTYSKLTAKIKLNGEKQSNSTTIRNKTRLFTLSHLINIVLGVLAMAIREHKEMKGIQIGKEEAKLLLFADDMIVYISDHKNLPENSDS